MEALENAGLPAAGTALAGAKNLVLVERNPRIIDQTKVEVTLVYEHFNNEGQSIDKPVHGIVFIKSRTALNQVTTNKYIDTESA